MEIKLKNKFFSRKCFECKEELGYSNWSARQYKDAGKDGGEGRCKKCIQLPSSKNNQDTISEEAKNINIHHSKNVNHESNKILHEKVRYEILRRFGYFVTESSEHFAEYVPWFIKKNRKDLIEKYKIPINEYIDRCEHYVKTWEKLDKDVSPINNEPLKLSHEYASYIMDSITNNKEININANVMNKNLIDNLPQNCCVEVPCTINSEGYLPQKIGNLPEQLAALMRTNINVQILTAEAALTKKREHIYHAAMLDPLTSSNLSIDEIYKMTDELINAHGNYLPNYN